MNKLKICFCALSAYPLLAKNNTGFIGGAELQQAIIAKELAKNKYDVSFVVSDHGQESIETFDGIKVYKTVQSGYRLSNFVSISLAARKFWKKLNEVDADIYFQACSGYLTGFIGLYCMIKRKKFIYQLASDMDVDRKYINKLNKLEGFLYSFGVKRANCIIAQSLFQKNSLTNLYRKEAIVIKNPFPIDDINFSNQKKPIVIWVGSIKPKWKHPELFLEIANALPSIQFKMIGGPTSDINFYKKIRDYARTIPNVEFVGFVPYPEVNKYFEEAFVLVNTSSVEGFSNTFLQAWAAYTPVISLNIDPDEIISNYNLGFHSRNIEQLIRDIELLVNDNKLRLKMGENGRKYVEKEHNLSLVINKYINIFEDI